MVFLHWIQYVLAFGNGALLQFVTIVVLFFAWLAARKQAKAAEKLTEATERQIQTATEQAKAAKEQVDVARRQVTEALRPILVQANPIAPGMRDNFGQVRITLRNDGLGVALEVWWTYGDAKGEPFQRNYVQSGIMPPKSERSFRAKDTQLVQQGVLIAYESLTGLVSATRITWTGHEYHTEYKQDITYWAGNLLDRPLRPID